MQLVGARLLLSWLFVFLSYSEYRVLYRRLLQYKLGVCGIDFQSSVRFGTECQYILRNRFGTEFYKVRGAVRNRFGIKISL